MTYAVTATVAAAVITLATRTRADVTRYAVATAVIIIDILEVNIGHGRRLCRDYFTGHFYNIKTITVWKLFEDTFKNDCVLSKSPFMQFKAGFLTHSDCSPILTLCSWNLKQGLVYVGVKFLSDFRGQLLPSFNPPTACSFCISSFNPPTACSFCISSFNPPTACSFCISSFNPPTASRPNSSKRKSSKTENCVCRAMTA
ncbi:hypothetical protein MAR_016171 [Mya arenaria]|uniref:Uncharacterized protein n=1 Tax=Mya arenaria TaxID=6604 RepID=A0ABY7FMB6_MYAAR|nr:hypothetical protein MAR_016171 [Mya arenaria]